VSVRECVCVCVCVSVRECVCVCVCARARNIFIEVIFPLELQKDETYKLKKATNTKRPHRRNFHFTHRGHKEMKRVREMLSERIVHSAILSHMIISGRDFSEH
jgi:hypothetical protein